MNNNFHANYHVCSCHGHGAVHEQAYRAYQQRPGTKCPYHGFHGTTVQPGEKAILLSVVENATYTRHFWISAQHLELAKAEAKLLTNAGFSVRLRTATKPAPVMDMDFNF